MAEDLKLREARDAVIEQACEAAMDGSGHDGLDAAVYRYLLACGDDELAADMRERNAALGVPAGRSALTQEGK